MADETTTGAKTDVAVDKEKLSDNRRKMVRIVVIIAVALLVYWLAKKYIF